MPPRTVITLILCVAYVPALPTQEPAQPRFRSTVEVVRVNALVTDRRGPVLDLAATDFELLDNGVPQRVQSRLIQDLAIDVIMALDASQSIAPDMGTLLKTVTTAFRKLRPLDRVATVVFTNRIRFETLNQNHEQIASGVTINPKAGAYTSALDAVFTALTLVDPGDRPTLLLVFTDGFDTASWLEPQTVLALAARSDVTIQLISPDGGSRFPLASWFVRLAETTGGEVWRVAQSNSVEQALSRAIDRFRVRYELQYTASNTDKIGWHEIVVRVRNRPRASVRARPGYFR
jgi:VWFA-related protein